MKTEMLPHRPTQRETSLSCKWNRCCRSLPCWRCSNQYFMKYLMCQFVASFFTNLMFWFSRLLAPGQSWRDASRGGRRGGSGATAVRADRVRSCVVVQSSTAGQWSGAGLECFLSKWKHKIIKIRTGTFLHNSKPEGLTWNQRLNCCLVIPKPSTWRQAEGVALLQIKNEDTWWWSCGLQMSWVDFSICLYLLTIHQQQNFYPILYPQRVTVLARSSDHWTGVGIRDVCIS